MELPTEQDKLSTLIIPYFCREVSPCFLRVFIQLLTCREVDGLLKIQ